MKKQHVNIRLYTIAGIYTAPNFMDILREKLTEMLGSYGYSVSSQSLFPYGDWSRSKTKQAAEIACDLVVPAVGGRRLLKDLLCDTNGTRDTKEGEKVLLLGHSGGGVAAVRAGAALIRKGEHVAGIVMIGSPKIPSPRALRDKILYLYASDHAGTVKDPITRLGGWRGRPPVQIQGLQLIGGHPDYFRTAEPFRNDQGKTNLEITLETLVPWLVRRLRS